MTKPPPRVLAEVHVAPRDAPVSEEASKRKDRSLARLREVGVPFIEHLPVIETEDASFRRSGHEVAVRAIALMLVAVKGEGVLNKAEMRTLIVRYECDGDFTPRERAFVDHPAPCTHDKIQFCWRYEAATVLVWSLGYSETLPWPDAIVDAAWLTRFLQSRGRERFIAEGGLRPQAQLLDEADLVYRLRWACRDAWIKGAAAPVGLDSGVISERHHALNWLIGASGPAWDDVTTST